MCGDGGLARNGDYAHREGIYPGPCSSLAARPPRNRIAQNLTLKYTIRATTIVGVRSERAELGAVRNQDWLAAFSFFPKADTVIQFHVVV